MTGPSSLTGARVAVVNWRDLDHHLAGGAERYAWELATALCEAGAEVHYVTGRDAGQSAEDVRDGIAVHRGGGGFGYYAHAARWLLRHRRQLDAVIDAETGIPAFAPLWVRRRTPVALLMHHVHQDQFTTYFRAPLAGVGRWLERVAMPRVYRRSRTVAVSESTVDEMRRRLGWTGPVGLLPNGSTDPVDGLTGADKDVDRVVVLGRLVGHKRVDLVVRAVAALVAERPGLHLDVCGQGPDLEPLQALAAELGVADRVTFHGWVDDEQLATILTRAALHVCASDVEGWGQAVLEVAAHGVPTVARDVPGLRDSVLDGETGVLVPDDPDLAVVQRRLTDAVRTVLADLEEPEHRHLAVKATQSWAATFSWRAMRAQSVRLVSDLIHPTPAPRPTER